MYKLILANPKYLSHTRRLNGKITGWRQETGKTVLLLKSVSMSKVQTVPEVEIKSTNYQAEAQRNQAEGQKQEEVKKKRKGSDKATIQQHAGAEATI